MTFNGGQNNVAYTLPEDFLLGPGPNVQVQKIDFAKTLLSEYQGLYAVILDNVLSKKECDTLVRAAEAHTNGKWEQAMINIGAGHQRLITEARDCSRIIWDDHAIAAKIWARVEKFVPEISQLKNAPKITGTGPARRGETWQMSRLNERLRFLRYGAGQYFRPHMDGTYVTPDGEERSYVTLHLYLNESDTSAPEGKLEGGATTFHSCLYNDDLKLDVEPKTGRVLIFQHRNLLHSGADVTAGIKLTMRTDLMYRQIQ